MPLINLSFNLIMWNSFKKSSRNKIYLAFSTKKHSKKLTLNNFLLYFSKK